MTRVMGDSVSLLAVPAGVQVAATYATGPYAAAGALVQQRFPHDRYGWCRIDVNGAMPSADARDWEAGDKSGSLEQWVAEHNAEAGKRTAVVYCNRATIPQVRQLTGSQLLGRDYFLWVATLDGTVVAPGADHLEGPPYTYPGVVACQLRGAGLTGGNWDQSLVFDDALWTPAAPPAPPAPLVSRAQAQAALAGILAELALLGRAAGEIPLPG